MSDSAHPTDPIADVLFGDCSPDERAALERRLAAADGAPWLELLSQVRALEGELPYAGDLDVFRQGVHAKIAESLRPRAQVARRTYEPVVRARVWPMGASIAALAVALAVAIVLAVPVVTSRWMSSGDRGTHAGERQYATRPGQRAEITLIDGSRVHMAPNTILRVASDFGGRTRTVSLRGEARFDVASAPAPFIVRSGAIDTRVLGTVFSVAAWPPAHDVQVSVQSGKVSSRGERGLVVVSAGQTARVTDSTAALVAPDDLHLSTDWSHGQLIFRDAPAPEVLATLSRWYGYQFRVNDSTVAGRRLTVAFDMASSTNAFDTIELFLKVDLTIDGNVVTLVPRRPRASARRDLRHPLSPSSAEVGR